MQVAIEEMPVNTGKTEDATCNQGKEVKTMYPTKRNMIDNPLGINKEAIDSVKQKTIFDRIVGVYNCPENDRFIGPEGFMDYLGEALRNRSAENYQWLYTPACNLTYTMVGNEVVYYPVAYTGLMDCDILQEDNQDMDMQEVKKYLCQLPQIAYCGRNYYGSGLMCLVPIMAPQRYTEHAKALRKAFARSGLHVRVNYNVLHSRLVSYDPDAYFNEEAVEFKILDYP